MDDWKTQCMRIMNGERTPYCYENSPYCYGCSMFTLTWEQRARERLLEFVVPAGKSKEAKTKKSCCLESSSNYLTVRLCLAINMLLGC